MKQELRSAHIGTRIIPVSIDLDATPSFNYGGYDLSAVAGTVSSEASLSVSHPFSRGCVAFWAPGANVANGGFVSNRPAVTAFSKSALAVRTTNQSGTADDGTAYGFVVGNDSPHADVSYKRWSCVKITRPHARLLRFIVNTASSGSFTFGGRSATLVRNGTGDVTITFRRPFVSNDVIAVPTFLHSSNIYAPQVSSPSRTSVRVKLFNTSQSAVDGVFHMVVLGFDNSVPTPNLRRPLWSPGRKPRLFAVHIASQATSVDYNSGVISAAETSTGVIGVTFTDAFGTAPVVILCGDACRATLKTVSTTGFTANLTNAAGTLAHAGFSAFVVGSDDADEYGDYV